MATSVRLFVREEMKTAKPDLDYLHGRLRGKSSAAWYLIADLFVIRDEKTDCPFYRSRAFSLEDRAAFDEITKCAYKLEGYDRALLASIRQLTSARKP